jgi:hypothetical protein
VVVVIATAELGVEVEVVVGGVVGVEVDVGVAAGGGG